MLFQTIFHFICPKRSWRISPFIAKELEEIDAEDLIETKILEIAKVLLDT